MRYVAHVIRDGQCRVARVREMFGVCHIWRIECIRIECAFIREQRRRRCEHNICRANQAFFAFAHLARRHVRIRRVLIHAMINHQLFVEPSNHSNVRGQKNVQNRTRLLVWHRAANLPCQQARIRLANQLIAIKRNHEWRKHGQAIADFPYAPGNPAQTPRDLFEFARRGCPSANRVHKQNAILFG